MAWTGEVMRRLVSATPTDAGCRVRFDCQHEQDFDRPPFEVLRALREYPCDQCSAPSRERIKRIQASISFDDVLHKLRELPKEER